MGLRTPTEGRVLIDPNAASSDGTTALAAAVPSPSGRLVAWSYQALGSDWCTWRIRDVETGEEYWISGPKKDVTDRLYGERVAVDIDDDVRDEYWTEIRRQPERVHDGDASR